MPTVRRKVAEHNSSSAERIHELVMDLVRATGLLQPERTVPGHPLSMSQAFALHELDTDTPLSQRELTERLGLEKSSVSRLAATSAPAPTSGLPTSPTCRSRTAPSTWSCPR